MANWNQGPGYHHVVHHHYPGGYPPPPSAYQSQPYSWVPALASSCRHLVSTAVVGGYEANRSPVWVVRAHHAGDLIPGKLALDYNTAYVAHNGDEHEKSDVEVLCADQYRVRWIPSSYGSLPPGVVSGGSTGSGEPLFVGRTHHENGLYPGKIHPTHQCIYISYGGREISYKNYEALVIS